MVLPAGHPDVAMALARFDARIDACRSYGVNDCCVSVADVIAAAWRCDPMALFRGTYHSRIGYRLALRRRGFRGRNALVAAIEHGALAAGAVPSDVRSPLDFDLGIVGVPEANAVLAVPAFRLSGLWHAQTREGLALVETAQKAWRLHG